MTWWLRPEWKDARCLSCGVNIWDSGGDPDHGLCPECWSAEYRRIRIETSKKYPCDICGFEESSAAVNGYNVCSQICHDNAKDKTQYT